MKFNNSIYDLVDHYRAIELAPTQNIHEEIDYRAQNISEDTIFTQSEDNLVSFEKINVRKLSTLRRYLQLQEDMYNYGYLQNDSDFETKEKERQWISTMRASLDSLLNNIDNKRTFATPEYLFHQTEYKKITHDQEGISSPVGRLYAPHSLITYPREVRYYLFKDEYLDYDIVNSHPTLSYLYSLDNNLECNTLAEYVHDRDEMLLKIKFELERSGSDFETDNPKRRVLLQMNRTWKKTPTGSEILDRLDDDFSLIRDHLWSSFLDGLLDEYTAVVSLKHYSDAKLRSKNLNTEEDKERLKRVILQAFYFHDQETKNLQHLAEFLRKQYRRHLKDIGVVHLSDLVQITDKTVNLPAEHTLYTIPFYDGLFISSECKSFQEKIPGLMDIYNQTKALGVRFERKEISLPSEIILRNPEEYKKFEIINNWLSTPTNSRHISSLLRITGGHAILHEIEANSFSQLKAIFTEVRLLQYLYLLKQDFKCDSELTDIIKDQYADWKVKDKQKSGKKSKVREVR